MTSSRSWGRVYGTRLGTVYAEQFPQNVRAMLLDGAIDPNQGTFERRVGAYAGFQRSFEQMAAFCATQVDCPLGDDPARATGVFHQIVRPLHGQTVPALNSDLDFDEAIGGVISGLYSEEAWPRIITGITQLQTGTRRRAATAQLRLLPPGRRGPLAELRRGALRDQLHGRGKAQCGGG